MSARTSEDAFRSMKILEVLPLCGPSAAAWLQDFLGPDNEHLAHDTFLAIRHMRTHDIDEGRRLLEGVDHALRARNGAAPAATHILRRWHLSARAYYHYLCDDLDAAMADLESAETEIAAALAQHAFLIPLINHCVDFRIQRARIARRRHQWSEVRRHVGVLRAMFADQRPYVTLPDGQSVYLRDLRAFYLRLPLSDEQREAVRSVLDPQYPHDRELDRLEENIFAIPDFVIPYP